MVRFMLPWTTPRRIGINLLGIGLTATLVVALGGLIGSCGPRLERTVCVRVESRQTTCPTTTCGYEWGYDHAIGSYGYRNVCHTHWEPCTRSVCAQREKQCRCWEGDEWRPCAVERPACPAERPDTLASP